MIACILLENTSGHKMTRNERELEIRKLRKKLRQIENLELLERDLSEEECLKVFWSLFLHVNVI